MYFFVLKGKSYVWSKYLYVNDVEYRFISYSLKFGSFTNLWNKSWACVLSKFSDFGHRRFFFLMTKRLYVPQKKTEFAEQELHLCADPNDRVGACKWRPHLLRFFAILNAHSIKIISRNLYFREC